MSSMKIGLQCYDGLVKFLIQKQSKLYDYDYYYYLHKRENIHAVYLARFYKVYLRWKHIGVQKNRGSC